MSFGYTETATVWTLTLTGGSGPFNPPTETWVRSEIKAEWQSTNETRKDDTGAEFIPRSVYYSLTAAPKGARILPGNIASATPPANAETVRSVDSGSAFPGDPVEFEIVTA